MDWLLNLIPGGGLTAIGAALVTALGLLLGLFKMAKKSGRDEQLVKEAKAREENIKDIIDAADARPTDSVHDDPHNRDNREAVGVQNLMDAGGVQRQKRQPGNRGGKSKAKRKA